jgi:two-component system, NtrC family, sensor kinase
MRWLLYILFSFSMMPLWAQNAVTDSLKVALSRANEDTNKVNSYAELSFAFAYLDPDTALSYASTGLNLANRLDFKRGEIPLLITMGEASAMKGDLAKALEMKLEALQKAERLNDPFLIAQCHNFLGASYFYSNDYHTALMYYYRAMANKQWYETFKKDMLGQIGHCYLILGNMDSAYKYAKQAYDLDQKDLKHWSIVYIIMGKIEDIKGNYPKALQFFKQASVINQHSNIDMALMFKKMGRTDSAIYYAKEVFVRGESLANYYSMVPAGELLTELYKSNRAIDSAFKYQELMIASKDSLYSQEKIKQIQNLEFNERQRQEKLEQQRIEAQHRYETRVKLYSLIAGLAVLALISIILYRNNRHKQRTNALLQDKNQKIESTLSVLKATQAQLIQSEKMASLGELTAGIAHEIQNPLNFVNNFSEVSNELLEEMKTKLKTGDGQLAIEIADDVKQNLEKIIHHGKRADAIVKGMLQHSRISTGQKELTNINTLADEYLRLAYHGIRAKDNFFNVNMKTDFDQGIEKIKIIPQDIGKVILNLVTNAFYAVNEKKKQDPDHYEPIVTVSTKGIEDKIEILVTDNGNGIPKKLVDKIFQPFFTTKPPGEGTGLGLSLSYDIIKAHSGEIRVQSKEGEGSEFIVSLPYTA